MHSACLLLEQGPWLAPESARKNGRKETAELSVFNPKIMISQNVDTLRIFGNASSEVCCFTMENVQMMDVIVTQAQLRMEHKC
jgi:hypothetical protein